MLVELTKAEVAEAHGRADAIQARKRAAGVRSNVYHADTAEVMRQAMRAEAAFHKTFPMAVRSEVPLLPDGTEDPRAGDGGWDFMFPRSRVTVDVKSRTGQVDRLIIPGMRWPPVADLYVLGIIRQENEVLFVGWATAEYLLDHAREAEGNQSGPYLWVPVDNLRPMSELIREVR